MSSTKTAFLLQIVKNVTIKNVLKKRCYLQWKKTNYETKLNSEFPDNLKLAGVTYLHKSVRIF